MKKLILILILLSEVCFASPHTNILGKIENALYGFQYNTESDESRMQRIENTVYGETQNGDFIKRLNKIKTDISAEQIGEEITPCEDTFAENEYYTEESLAQSNIQYPAVDEIELITFNKVSNNQNIKARLSALEQNVFGKIYTDDLATRVDRLKAQVKPKSLMNNAIAQSSNDFFEDEGFQLEQNYHLDRYESPNRFDFDTYNRMQNNSIFGGRKANLTTVENNVLRRTFQNDKMDSRLSRLENRMFGTEFTDDDEQTRINRITSAYKAQKNSSKYDSNKFARNMTTAMQIGTILLMMLACIL